MVVYHFMFIIKFIFSIRCKENNYVKALIEIINSKLLIHRLY